MREKLMGKTYTDDRTTGYPYGYQLENDNEGR
jgi:hypothetical protein